MSAELTKFMSKTLTQLEAVLHGKFVKAGLDRKALTNKLLSMIPEIEQRGLHIKKGCKDIFEYGMKYAGLSYSSIKDARRIYKKTSSIKACKGLIENLGITKAASISRVADKDNSAILIAKSRDLSTRAVKTMVNEIKNSKLTSDDRKEELLKIDLNFESKKIFFRIKNQLKLEGSNNNVLASILSKMELMLKDKNKSPKKVIARQKSKSRHIPVAVKREIKERSGCSCEFENCSQALKEYHHTAGYSITKSHEGVVGLCKEHHELMHAGIISNEIAGPKKWHFDLNNSFQEPGRETIDKKRREIRRRYYNSNASP